MRIQAARRGSLGGACPPGGLAPNSRRRGTQLPKALAPNSPKRGTRASGAPGFTLVLQAAGPGAAAVSAGRVAPGRAEPRDTSQEA